MNEEPELINQKARPKRPLANRIWMGILDLSCALVLIGAGAGEIILIFAILFCDDPSFCTRDKGLAMYTRLMGILIIVPIIYIVAVRALMTWINQKEK